MMALKSPIRWILCVLILSFSATGFAANYIVEIVAFSHRSDHLIGGEDLTPKYPIKISPHRNAQLLPNDPSQENAVKEGIYLSNITTQLEEHGSYDVIAHLAWHKPARSRSDATPIQLSVGALSGEILLYSRRLLFVDMNLDYQPKAPDTYIIGGPNYELKAEIATEKYSIRELRRIKIRELAHFDHPKFGVILTIRRASN